MRRVQSLQHMLQVSLWKDFVLVQKCSSAIPVKIARNTLMSSSALLIFFRTFVAAR